MPVRVERDGVFHEADLTLERQGDEVAPRMSGNGVSFGGGGNDVLATMVRDGKSLTLTWLEGTLPTPVLHGETATYPDAGGAGVDVVVKSTPTGWSHYVVIKTAEAARNPALAKIEFGVRATGLTLQERDGEQMVAVDSAGQEVFSAPTAFMWEGNVEPDQAAGLAPTPDEVTAGPGPRAEAKAMKVEVATGKLALVPDQGLLTSADTKLPIVLDPAWMTWNTGREVASPGWAYVDKKFPNQAYTKPDRLPVGYESEDGTDKRSYIRMETSELHEGSGDVPVKINSVAITFDTGHAWSCVSRDIRLFNVEHISSSTTWNNAPGAYIPAGSGWSTNFLASAPVDVGRPECGDSGTSNDVKFTGGNLVRWMQWATDHTWNFATIGLFPEKDYDVHNWKVFDIDPRMVVQFSRVPFAPRDVHLLNGGTDKKACVAGANRPVLGGSADRTLRAKVTDLDADHSGGAQGQPMRAQFDIAPLGAPTEITTKYSPSTGYAVTSATDGYLHVAVPAPADTASGADGGSGWMWRVRGQDAAGLSGPWSSWCEYTVDTKRPNQPTVSATGYTEGQWGGYDADARKYTTGQFTLGSAGSNDVEKYYYRFSDGTEQTVLVAPGASASFDWTPQRFGLQWVEVTSFDRAGNISPAKKFEFGVTQPPRDAAWAMDEPSGERAKAIGADGAVRPAADVVFDNGATLGEPGNQGIGLDRAVRLDGTSQFGEVKPFLDEPQSVPLVDTSKRFMFSTWVKLASISGDQVTLSQTAADGNVFELGWLGGRWTMRLRQPDGTVLAEVKRDMAQAGDGTSWTQHWVSLMGGYDPLNSEIWLRTQATGDSECSPNTPPWECSPQPIMAPELQQTTVNWQATVGVGSLLFGATTAGAAKGSYWNGWIDDSQLWPLARPDETVLRVIYGESVHDQEFAGQVLRLVNAGSGQCLDVTGASSASGANIIQWNCNAGPTQNWRFSSVGDGYYTLTNPSNAKCLDVDSSDGAGTADGRNVQQLDCNGSDSQKWLPEKKSLGYWLKAKVSGKCLAVADPTDTAGSNVHQWSCGDPLQNEQVWQITDQKHHELNTITYRLGNAGSGKCLQPAADSTSDGAAMVQAACNDTPAQDWTFNYTGDGHYTLTNSSSRLCLAVTGNADARGSALVQQTCAATADGQAWKVLAVGADGNQGYRLFSKYSGLAAEVKDASPVDDAPIVQDVPAEPAAPKQTWNLRCLPTQTWRCPT